MSPIYNLISLAVGICSKLKLKDAIDGSSFETAMDWLFLISYYCYHTASLHSPWPSTSTEYFTLRALSNRHQGPVVKKDPFRYGPKNSPFRENSPFQVSENGLFSRNGPSIKTDYFLQQAPVGLF